MEPKEVRHARNAWIELAESPSSEVASGLSPMSVLAHDLGAASLLADASLRRRLSLNSQTNSPAPTSPLNQLHRIRPKELQDNNVSFDSLPRSPLCAQNCENRDATSTHSPMSKGLFRCLSGGSDSLEADGFVDFLVDKENEGAAGQGAWSPSAPSGLGALLNGRIQRRCSPLPRVPATAKRSLHRTLSANTFLSPPPPTHDTPTSSKGFKRPEAVQSGAEPPPAKRRRCESRGALTQSSLLNFGFSVSGGGASGRLQRSLSDTDAIIKSSVERSSADALLVGDFSRPFALPLVQGKHSDLKTISADTLADLIHGRFKHSIDAFSIIDCRYPYEFSGGHIEGARNLYTREQVTEALVAAPPPPSAPRRHVLVFHCEFSSERAPCLSRYLRNCDRQANKECYPQLHWPEVYLLHGGYKAFFEAHAVLCQPRHYVPMLNSGNEADLRHFRAKSRSWAGAELRAPRPLTFKRLDV